MSKAVFLDRDGTLIEDKGYICSFQQVRIFPFSFEAVRLFNLAGYQVIVITNQSSIARGICTAEQVEHLHDQLNLQFRQHEAVIQSFYYCPYHPDGTVKKFSQIHDWRKPAPGMILQAGNDFNLDLTSSIFIGDSYVDIRAGKNAGCRTALVLTGQGSNSEKVLANDNIVPDHIFTDIKEAAQILLDQETGRG